MSDPRLVSASAIRAHLEKLRQFSESIIVDYHYPLNSRSRLMTVTTEVKDEKKDRKVDVEFAGDKIVLPEDMTYDEGIQALHRIRDEEATEVTIAEIVKAFPLDGAVAFQKALKRRFGWQTLVPTRGFWGEKIKPHLIGVEIAHNETVQIPWGNCQVPKIEGHLSTGFAEDDGMPVFKLGASVKRRWERDIKLIADEVREIVTNESIYRGKAIKLKFRDTDGERRGFDPSFAPKFMKLEKKHVVFATETEKLIEVNLFNPVIYTQKCREQQVPLKRGVLLEGRYGTGKTLTANLLADLCVKNGWTFLYVDDVRDIDLAMEFAKLYQPCVLFAEDVDRMIPNGPRTPDIDRVLNTLDGVESKNAEIMVVFTTNNVNNIHPGFLRAGRIDVVVPIHAPDEAAILKLLRHYGQDASGNQTISGSDEELLKAAKLLRKTNASFVRETVERAKLSAIASCNGKLAITPANIEVAAQSLEKHMKMVCPDSGTPDLDLDGEVVDPAKMAIDLLMDQFTNAFINRIADPRTLEKIIVKKMGRRPSSGFGNNN